MRLRFWRKKPAVDIEALAEKVASADPAAGRPIIIEGSLSLADIARLRAATSAAEERIAAKEAEALQAPKQAVQEIRTLPRRKNAKKPTNAVRPRPNPKRGAGR